MNNKSKRCDNCGGNRTSNWYYRNGLILCRKCYRNSKYKYGQLDPNSAIGFGFISQRVVAKTLGLKLKYDCNCRLGFKSSYDLYDNIVYDYINVKGVKIINNIWIFNFRNKEIPNTYICLGYDENKNNIKHVWIFKPNYDIILFDKITIGISNSLKGLKRVEQYEVDVKSYNDMYHSMSLKNCSVLKSELTEEEKQIKEEKYQQFKKEFFKKHNLII